MWPKGHPRGQTHSGRDGESIKHHPNVVTGLGDLEDAICHRTGEPEHPLYGLDVQGQAGTEGFDSQVVEGGDRIGLGPDADPAWPG